MNALEWLRALGRRIPGMTPNAMRKLEGYAPRLELDFPPDAFTDATAHDAADGMLALPKYPDLKRLLDSFGPFHRPTVDEDRKLATHWITFTQRRLAEGGPSAHLRSLLRAYCPKAHLAEALRACFPAEARREAEEHARRVTDKARAVGRVPMRLAAQRYAAPPPPHGPSGASAPAPERRPPPLPLAPDLLAQQRAAAGYGAREVAE